ncbi:DUF748 domain-containing protein [Ramlibacter sp. WS9]|uniref:DUF748 domain-containing protein n=1 Tax=Ramlibacter sp. WS9 TaxID=1882741 RepID=UPI001144BAF3|nr:DUF748 domain-containing protein [Ramlibacter sp. WS9]ROZ76240.1 DUF748 domain-containing protein [Ramlibacter sp. WS9]
MEIRDIRRARWAAAAAGGVVLYALAGFWGVPALVRHQVPKLIQQELGRKATLGEVRFNPFTLRLEARDVRLDEAGGAPLLGIGELAVEMQWRSLVRRAWSFAEIRILRPNASLVVAKDGRFNLAELIATYNARPRDPGADAALPRLVIEQFTLEEGKVDMQDLRAGYANVFTPITFTLANFSTLPGQNDDYTLSAQSARGGKLRWKGRASLDPVQASGEFALEDGSLPDLGAYLKPYTHARVAAGSLSATLPYTFAYDQGKFDARLVGARLALAGLALSRDGDTDAFAALSQLQVSGINVDLVRADASLGEVRAEGGKLRVVRDAKGELDLARLMIEAAGPAAAPKPAPEAPPRDWKLTALKVVLEKVAIDAVDQTVQPAVSLGITAASLQLRAAASQQRGALQVEVADAAMVLDGISLGSGGQSPIKLARLGFADGKLDLAARRASLGSLRAEGGQLLVERNDKGAVNLLALVPGAGASKPTPAPTPRGDGSPWTATAGRIELIGFTADVADQGSGVKVRAHEIALLLEGAGTDLKQPVKFDGSFALREGGKLAAKGRIVPASGETQADVQVKQLALAPLQPLLAQFVRLNIAGGQVNAQGRLATGSGVAKSPTLRYVGALDVNGLVLNEDDGDLFASWKSVAAPKLTATLGPQGVDIPELRVTGANAKLIIEDDRSFNAARLLVKPPAAPAPAAAASAPATPATGDDLNIHVRRIRLQDAKLDFADLSLRPQFAAKIFELNGAINGLSSARDTRSQIELDGRVDEFGSARIRGELNPFALSNNTDVNVVFKNVDMVSASPYSMKFAGYRIAQGKISLDLGYKIRNSQLEGANQIVIDQLTLGERVDSPDALKLPLELAIAILKDNDGRIDLGLPVSGDMNDPQFSYGAIVWKAIGNVLAKIVTSPFRALGGLLGVSGDKLESIDFDAGSAKLLPPEREKLKQMAQILAKRAQLKLAVPGHYSETADGAALRMRAVRLEVAKRAGLKLEAGEEPGPIDVNDRAVRKAMRELYAERFGDAELDKAKKTAETAAPASPGASAPAPDKLPVWQRVTKMVQGEPQVADAGAFYAQLQQRLNQNQKLAPDALAQLGAQRAEAVVAALKEAGADAARATAGPPANIEAAVGKPVALKLELAAR